MKKLIFIIVLNICFVAISFIKLKATVPEPDCKCESIGGYVGPACKMQSLPGNCPGGGWGMFSKCVKDTELNWCNCDNEGNDCQ